MPSTIHTETQRPDHGQARPLESCRTAVDQTLSIPPPATVRGNDWRSIAVAPPAAFRPKLGVSVIVPFFEAQRKLECTLAALDGQTYPHELLEVVVVDDGSRTPPEIPAESNLDISLVRQQSQGFELARARNNGARAARYDILVFLDGDMMADGGMVEAHARWHHAVGDVLTFGFRTFIEARDIEAPVIRAHAGALDALFSAHQSDPDWREPHLRVTENLAAEVDAPFRIVSGCNFAMHKAFYFAVGGSDETFTAYAHEDIEFAYRVYTQGGILIPVKDAHSWHQGRWADGATSKARARRLQSHKAAQLIAHPWFRAPTPGTIFAVPRHVITIPAKDTPAEKLAGCVDQILADPEYDLVVRIDTGQCDTGAMALQSRFSSNPRVRIVSGGNALTEFSATPFHLDVPPTNLPPRLVQRMRLGLGRAVSATATLDCGARVTIVRGWALHRAARAGGVPADYGMTHQFRLRRAWSPALSMALVRELLDSGAWKRTAIFRCCKRAAQLGFHLMHRLLGRLRKTH